MKKHHRSCTWLVLIGLGMISVLALAACAGPVGPAGPAGPAGAAGPAGPAGTGLTDAQSTAVADAAALATAIPMEYTSTSRGCPACHKLVDKTKGNYTLAWEASNATDGKHPTTAPDGTSMNPTDDVNVTVCLQCHAPGADGKGNVAPIMLSDIVHPVHMGSPTFTRELDGNCFSCHNVDANGNFNLLTQAVEVDAQGVPNTEDLPIPGAIVP
jgi:hypothetical protein